MKTPRISTNDTAPSETPSSSAEIVANNDHLLCEILLRLPITTLLCFKSVSKRWLSLISNPHFSRQRTRLHNPAASGLFLPRPSGNTNPEFHFLNLSRSTKRSCSPSTALSFVEDPFGIKILQSCNGLLLCCSSGPHQTKKYYVYNPTTSHCTTLPQVPVDPYNGASRAEFSLAFDPCKSPHYKVVCVWILDSTTQVEIFSSETVSWRLCSGSFLSHLPPYNVQRNGGVFWNGAIHWIRTWGAATATYFNVNEERMSEMPLPLIPEEWECWDDLDFGYFGESGGHLHLVGMYDRPSTRFNVYEMESDYSSWFVKFSVDLNEVYIAFLEIIPTVMSPQDLANFEFSILCVIRCVLEEESYLVMHIKGTILVYYLKSNTFKKLCNVDDVDLDGRMLYWGWFNAYQYIESLACV